MSLVLEFEKLKSEYKIPTLKLEISGQRCKNFRCRAFYNEKNQTIVLPVDRLRPISLHSLLHEFCHGIQQHEGRLDNYWESFENMWSLEREAIEFAMSEYKKRYLAIANHSLTWDLEETKRICNFFWNARFQK